MIGRHCKWAKLLLICVLAPSSCSTENTAAGLSSQTVLIGSTAGDPAIKSMLSIDPAKTIDFIRWELLLSRKSANSGSFTLNIMFGEGEPNTRGFKGGGEGRVIEGTYTVLSGPKGDIYKFTSSKTPGPISLIKIDENVFHILTLDNKLMVGNGGWSYTLTKKDRIGSSITPLTSWTSSLIEDLGQEMIFDGRTPCVDLGRSDLRLSDDCLKLKWKVTLRSDPKTDQPTTYTLSSTMNRPRAVEGKWRMVKGTKDHPEALILQLDPDKPSETVSFLVGDENVLFFLDRNFRLLAGNEDFGFTLNRRIR